jgi:hypothetical protein
MTLEEALFSRSFVIASGKQSALSEEKLAEIGNSPNSFKLVFNHYR